MANSNKNLKTLGKEKRDKRTKNKIKNRYIYFVSYQFFFYFFGFYSVNTDNSNLYTLFAVINHQGKIDTGHYTMFSKHRGEVREVKIIIKLLV